MSSTAPSIPATEPSVNPPQQQNVRARRSLTLAELHDRTTYLRAQEDKKSAAARPSNEMTLENKDVQEVERRGTFGELSPPSHALLRLVSSGCYTMAKQLVHDHCLVDPTLLHPGRLQMRVARRLDAVKTKLTESQLKTLCATLAPMLSGLARPAPGVKPQVIGERLRPFFAARGLYSPQKPTGRLPPKIRSLMQLVFSFGAGYLFASLLS